MCIPVKTAVTNFSEASVSGKLSPHPVKLTVPFFMHPYYVRILLLLNAHSTALLSFICMSYVESVLIVMSALSPHSLAGTNPDEGQCLLNKPAPSL